MEKLAQIIANKLAKELNPDEDKQQVIVYGLMAFIQMFVFVFSVLILGLICKTVVEALIICFVVSFLRKYSGGGHVGSLESCTAIGVTICVVFSLLSKYFLMTIISPYVLIVVVVIVYLVCFFAVYKLAPVDCLNKPIKTDKKRARMRKGCFITLIVYLLISIGLLFLSFGNVLFVSYSVSLLLGLSWQVFTLTSFAKNILSKVTL